MASQVSLLHPPCGHAYPMSREELAPPSPQPLLTAQGILQSCLTRFFGENGPGKKAEYPTRRQMLAAQRRKWMDGRK